jgi:protein-S-isoprenylcysteine O-methyltransferase Ste14
VTAPFYSVCLLLVMTAWIVFTVAFVAIKPKLPTQTEATASAAPKTRDRRTSVAIFVQALGFFFMWLSFRPPFPTLARLPGPLALVVAAGAVVLAFVSGFLAVWARRTLGREWSFEARLVDAHRLVTAGPYSIVRHPIYAAMLGLWIATALAVARPWGILIGAPFMLLGTMTRVKLEDALLRGAFGDTFEAWARKTPAVIPFAPR